MVRHLGRGYYRPRWKELYYPRRPQLLSLPNHNIILSALEKQQVGVVVYFRALNRFPGGNADMRVMKFKFFLPSCWPDDPAVDKDQCLVTIANYSNRDGHNFMSQRPEAKWKFPCESIQKNVMETLMKVLKEKGGGTDLETHFLDDPTLDEWTSIEVLLQLPLWILPERIRSDIPDDVGLDSFPPLSSPSGSLPPINYCKMGWTVKEPFWIPPPARDLSGKWPLVFRFHQRVLPRNVEHCDTPTEGAKARLLKSIKKLFKLGNVTKTVDEFNSTFQPTREFNRFETQKFDAYACLIFLYD